MYCTMQETSLRPDIKLGRVASRSSSVSPLPPPPAASEFTLPPHSSVQLDYSSPFLCRLPLRLLQQPRPPGVGEVGGLLEGVDADYVNIMEKLGPGVGEVSDQSHLTQVAVGCEEDIQEDNMSTEEIIQQVSIIIIIAYMESLCGDDPVPDSATLCRLLCL